MDIGWELCCIFGCSIKHDKRLLTYIINYRQLSYKLALPVFGHGFRAVMAVLYVIIHVLIKVNEFKDIYSSCFDMEQESVSQQA